MSEILSLPYEAFFVSHPGMRCDSESLTTFNCYLPTLSFDKFPEYMKVSMFAFKENEIIHGFCCNKMRLNIEEQTNLEIPNVNTSIVLVKISDVYPVYDDVASVVVSMSSEWESLSIIDEVDYKIITRVRFF